MQKIKQQDKETNTISNIKNNLNHELENLIENKNFIFKKHDDINLTGNTLSASFCNQKQELLAYKCNIPVRATTSTTEISQEKGSGGFDRIGAGEILGLNQESSSNFSWFLPAVGVIGVGLIAVGIKQFWNKNSTQECNTLDDKNREKNEQYNELIPKV